MGSRSILGFLAVAVLAVAGCASTTGPPASGGGVGEPPLVGTPWQLASYRSPGAAAPVSVTTDSTIEFNARGRFFAHACNYFGGTARIDGSTIHFGWDGTSTAIGCSGELAALEQVVEATMTGAADWSIGAGVLTLTGRAGHVLTYRVRPSSYPNLTARTIVAGNRAGGQFRLAVDRPGDRLYLVFEERSAPGEGWGSAGMIAPGPKDCLANHVMPAGVLGGETFLAAWATPAVARVTTQASKGAPETPLTFYAVPGSTLRIAGLWTASFRPSRSPVTFYDRNGAVIAAYPNGPC